MDKTIGCDCEWHDLFSGECLSDSELHDRYDAMLDDCYPIVTMGELSWDPSRVLQELDPIAYRCGFNDWLDGESGETLEEL